MAGVEAQTEKVWSQAAKYLIPKLIYINKLDRDGASFQKTVGEIASRLQTWPAVCQIPWWEGGNGRFMGLGDAVNLQAYRWPKIGDGKFFEKFSLLELQAVDPAFCDEIKKARTALVERICEHDDGLIEKYLQCEGDHQAIRGEDIMASLRTCLIRNSSSIVPVFAGASFRNIGVQPLLDAVVQLLPSPEEIPDPEVSLGAVNGPLKELLNGVLLSKNTELQKKSRKPLGIARKPGTVIMQNLEACALAFKVVHDPRRGALVYVRVYSGTIYRSATLFNTNLQIPEKAQRLLRMLASESVDISEISTGQIGVIPGLRFARTGDTLISYTGLNPKVGPPAPLNTLQLRPIEVPPAVFFSSIECNSLSEEKPVGTALALLIREDPSLQLSVDEDSGQTVLSGMGEFHLEIAGDRLINDLKAKASMGKIEIAYRESILKASLPQTFIFDREGAGKTGKAGCIATVSPISDASDFVGSSDELVSTTMQAGNRITTSISLSHDPDAPAYGLPPHLSLFDLHGSLLNGALAALSRGITHSFPLHGTHVCLDLDPKVHLFGADTTPAALSSVARLATRAALQISAQDAGSTLQELVMNVIISVDETSLGAVSRDISSARGGHIISLGDDTEAPENFPLIDLSKVYTPPDPFQGPRSGNQYEASKPGRRTIVARVPLKEMIGYLKHLRKLTGGRGTFTMNPDQFERVVGQREKVLLKELKRF